MSSHPSSMSPAADTPLMSTEVSLAKQQTATSDFYGPADGEIGDLIGGHAHLHATAHLLPHPEGAPSTVSSFSSVLSSLEPRTPTFNQQVIQLPTFSEATHRPKQHAADSSGSPQEKSSMNATPDLGGGRGDSRPSV
jgi:hypothetical protein